MLRRLEADLTQAEVAAKMKVSDKTLRAWEYDQTLPADAEWQRLIGILPLADLLPHWEPNTEVACWVLPNSVFRQYPCHLMTER